PAPDLERRRAREQPGQKWRIDGLVHVDPVGADAGLTSVAELGLHAAVSCSLQVRIVKNYEWGVAAELEGQLFHSRGGLAHEQLTHLRRTREAHGPHGRMFGED